MFSKFFEAFFIKDQENEKFLKFRNLQESQSLGGYTIVMENKDPEKETKDNEEDCLDLAADEFEKEEKLNLTADDNDIIDMNKNPDNKEQNFGDAFKNMEDIFSKMEKDPAFDNFANNLLTEFMDKEILEEPLKEADDSYSKYLEENKDKIPNAEYERYNNQLLVIKEILTELKKEKTNKEDLIKLFEKMQEYGNPPPNISNSMNEGFPFNLSNLLNENNPTGNNNNNNPAGNNPMPQADCCIF